MSICHTLMNEISGFDWEFNRVPVFAYYPQQSYLWLTFDWMQAVQLSWPQELIQWEKFPLNYSKTSLSVYTLHIHGMPDLTLNLDVCVPFPSAVLHLNVGWSCIQVCLRTESHWVQTLLVLEKSLQLDGWNSQLNVHGHPGGHGGGGGVLGCSIKWQDSSDIKDQHSWTN